MHEMTKHLLREKIKELIELNSDVMSNLMALSNNIDIASNVNKLDLDVDELRNQLEHLLNSMKLDGLNFLESSNKELIINNFNYLLSTIDKVMDYLELNEYCLTLTRSINNCLFNMYDLVK